MKISGSSLAWACVVIPYLYLALVILASFYLDPGYYGILGIMLAANAGAVLFVVLVFDVRESEDYTSGVLKLVASAIGAASVLFSAVFLMADEVDHPGIRAALIAPVIVALLVLLWFINKSKKEKSSKINEEGTSETERPDLRTALVLTFLAALFALIWLIDEANKERPSDEDEH